MCSWAELGPAQPQLVFWCNHNGKIEYADHGRSGINLVYEQLARYGENKRVALSLYYLWFRWVSVFVFLIFYPLFVEYWGANASMKMFKIPHILNAYDIKMRSSYFFLAKVSQYRFIIMLQVTHVQKYVYWFSTEGFIFSVDLLGEATCLYFSIK